MLTFLRSRFNSSLVVSIPILLLRNSTITLPTKLGIGSFLSLSIFMMACTIIRIAGYSPGRSRATEVVWRVFWQYTEACVSVMMASATVFRKLLIARIGSQAEGHQKGMRMPSFVRKGTQEHQSTGRGVDQEAGNKPRKAAYIDLPDLPPAASTGP